MPASGRAGPGAAQECMEHALVPDYLPPTSSHPLFCRITGICPKEESTDLELDVASFHPLPINFSAFFAQEPVISLVKGGKNGMEIDGPWRLWHVLLALRI